MHNPRKRPPPPLPTPSIAGAPPADWSAAAFLIDKPHGWTSFDVCAKLRGALRGVTKKVGHAGTLDPAATGLLVVCAGKATKSVDSFVALDKEYTGTLRLGQATPSLDAETAVSEEREWEHVTDADLSTAASALTGALMQAPPMFSAVSVGGERLYEAARRGETRMRVPRAVSVRAFEVSRSPTCSDTGPRGSRDINFRIECSKGTYIRVLAADLGTAVGSAAHLVALRRTRIGDARVEDAWSVEALVDAARAAREERERREETDTGAADAAAATPP